MVREGQKAVASLVLPLVSVTGGSAHVASADGNFEVTPIVLPEEPVAGWRAAASDGDSCLALAGESSFGRVRLTVSPDGPAGARFEAHLEPSPRAASLEAVVVALHAARDEAPTFGMGIQYSVLDLRGRTVPVLTSEQGVGRGIQPTSLLLSLFGHGAGGSWHRSCPWPHRRLHCFTPADSACTCPDAPAPHYLTASAQQAWLDNDEFAEVDFARSARTAFRVMFAGDEVAPIVRLHMAQHRSPLAAVAAYTARMGRMPLPPDWVHRGAVLGAQGGTDAVLAVWRNVTAAGARISGVWMQVRPCCCCCCCRCR